MNSLMAKLLTHNITNDRFVIEMIMYICNKDNQIEDRLIDLCLGTDIKFVTKDMIMAHIDKVKPLCMNYMKNIINVSNIKVTEIDNISRVATVKFTAEIMAWFKDQESADKKYSGILIEKKMLSIDLKVAIMLYVALMCHLKI